MKRSPLKRGSKRLERKSEIRRVSSKKRARDRVWRRVKDETIERDGWICQAAHLVPQVSCGWGLDPHHIAKQSTTPQARLDPENVVWVCRRHHDWIDVNQLEAHGLGLHRSSWEYKATG